MFQNKLLRKDKTFRRKQDDTVLGPAYFGYGYTEGAFDAVYLVIGQHF